MVPHFVARTVELIHYYITPAPPRKLSGQWTQEERQKAVDDMFKHLTDGLLFTASPLLDPSPLGFGASGAMSEEFTEAVQLINTGTAQAINARWPELRMRYGIYADLPKTPPPQGDLERYGDM